MDVRSRRAASARRSAITLASLTLVPALAAAQPPTSDDQRLADELHAAIVDADGMTPDAGAAAQRLAALYGDGRGVARDPVMACSLAQYGEGAAMMRAEGYQAAVEQAQRIVKMYCEPLASAQRLEASRALGCFAFGLTPRRYALGGHHVEVTRSGVRMDDDPEIALGMNCALHVARVRVTSVPAPANAAPDVTARHFLEIFSWLPRRANGSLERVLSWQVLEIQNGKLALATFEHELWATTASWPRPAFPRELEARLTLTMIRSGNVRWYIDGTKPLRRGWILLPEEPGR